MSTPFVQETLPNGLPLLIEVMPDVQSAACGFLARTGARDDGRELAGVSHFLEHMMFKGTPRRTCAQINIEFDDMGAQYNAYTSKDRTFYYGWVRTDDFDRQLALLADMMESTLPSGEFDMEKNVVLEEIAMSNDDLASCAYDFLYAQLAPQSQFSWPVLGYEQTIRGLTRDQMHAYFRRRYAPNNLIFVAAGNVDPAAVIASVKKVCGHWQPADDLGPPRRPPALRTGIAVQQLDRFHQQAVILAFPSVPAVDPLNATADALAAILGGPNSRFYWNIMQKGLSIRAGVYREEYQDFGKIVLYGLCEPDNTERVLDAMREEAENITERGVEPRELQRVKNLRRTSIAIESEAPYYRLGQLVDDADYRGRPRTVAERLDEVDAVDEASLAAYLDRCPITGEGFLATVGPRHWLA
jgi:predicted Zn-dependent peptidase